MNSLWKKHDTKDSESSRVILASKFFMLAELILLFLTSTGHAFYLPFTTPPSHAQSTRARPLQVVPLVEDNASTDDTQPLLDWNASGSIGSLLMQMQRKEEEMRKLNKTLLDKENSLDLSSSSSSSSTPHRNTNLTDEDEEQLSESQSKLSRMNFATAKELDDAVSVRLTSNVGSETKILEMPSLYQILLNEEEQVSKEELPVLSRPSHYHDRIGRDMRHLAVSIASCIDDPSEWRLFCQQLQPSGGLRPLVDCIQEGAAIIRERRQDAPISDLIQNQYEESFLAASSSCRALRDLCGMSLELSAVITDGLLRANAATKNGPSLVDDLCTLLKFADENTDIPSNSRRKRKLRIRRRKKSSDWPIGFLRSRNEDRMKCKLYVTQLLLAMTCSSDSAVDVLRSNRELRELLLKLSSYNPGQKRRRWLRYPGELFKSAVSSKGEEKDGKEKRRRPFIEATSLGDDLTGKIQGTSNQVLAAIGYNQWVPKIPGQKGLRILCLDGGGSRGMTAVTVLDCLVKSLGGVEAADCFDLVVGTSTGAIIAFLVGLRRDSSTRAVKRYDELIGKIFTKSALSTTLLLFTTATYDESPFMNILSEILDDYTMLDSRADPAVPYVFAVTSKMSSNPTHVALFRNYNYNGGELPDPFLIKPEAARKSLGLPLELEDETIRKHDYPRRTSSTAAAPGIRQIDGSRHPGSFRVLQRYALRASTAAPTVFKPVMMGGEMYCDGGIVASNPSAIGIHEARNLFPGIPIELVVSIGTGAFLEQKSAPRIGWDGIIGQIVGSATDGEQIHHILEDILGEGGTAQLGRSSVSNTRYMRFNPVLGMPDAFPIDVTDPEKLELLKQIARDYMEEPEQKRKVQEIADVLQGRRGIRRWFRR